MSYYFIRYLLPKILKKDEERQPKNEEKRKQANQKKEEK